MNDAPRRPWRKVLGFAFGWPYTPRPVHRHRRVIRDRFNEMASAAHPSIIGGSAERLAELEAARDEALKAVS